MGARADFFNSLLGGGITYVASMMHKRLLVRISAPADKRRYVWDARAIRPEYKGAITYFSAGVIDEAKRAQVIESESYSTPYAFSFSYGENCHESAKLHLRLIPIGVLIGCMSSDDRIPIRERAPVYSYGSRPDYPIEDWEFKQLQQRAMKLNTLFSDLFLR